MPERCGTMLTELSALFERECAPVAPPRAREIVMHGGHNLHEEIPRNIAEEIRTVLDEL